MSVETLTVSDSGLKVERCGLLVGGDICYYNQWLNVERCWEHS